MSAKIHQFTCLQDNFGVLLHDTETGATAAIDAPESAAVEGALTSTGWKLTDILVTHHHSDHTDGIPELKRKYGCRVVGPRAEAERIKGLDATVAEGDIVKVGGLSAQVLETPGHTSGHISYWLEADKLAFVGDTLFSIGCGRILEGTAELMWNSLLKLRALPDDTQFFCGHEYTASNVAYARTIEPNNAALAARAEEVAKLRAAGKPTLPATIGAEKKTNPFLRADIAEVAASVGLSGSPAARIFAKIRAGKDTFRG
jgi:hydroxyacylglutathione hydrolase